MTAGIAAIEHGGLVTVKKGFVVEDYDLAATLMSGQAFRWTPSGKSWIGVIGSRWVRLEAEGPVITAEAVAPLSDWNWLVDYLQCELSLGTVLQSFPADAPMRAAVSACRGLRLLRQDPWECLASFILSSTKQIIQIQQIISRLCQAFGEPVATPEGYEPAHRFPCPARLARATEGELRSCKMGFRAPYLLETARTIAAGRLDLKQLGQQSVELAREQLMQLPGVGRKIADCVLLFAYGFQSAFPVDVWVMRALQELYFPQAQVNLKRLHQFSSEHFGPNAGYAQQYLFHYMRTRSGPSRPPSGANSRRRASVRDMKKRPRCTQ